MTPSHFPFSADADVGVELPRAPDLSQLSLSAEVRGLVSLEFMARHQLVPLGWSGERLQVAIGDPRVLEDVASLGQLLAVGVEPLLATPEAIEAVLRRYTAREPEGGSDSANAGIPAWKSDGVIRPPGDDGTGIQTEDTPTADDAPLISLVHRLLLDAIQGRASDIHFEPLGHRFRIRHRVDGVLLEVENPPAELQRAIISRLKIMANLSIAEKRQPQDGRIRLSSGGRQFDLRVSCLPTVHGEGMAMRILEQERVAPGLSELGLFPDDAENFRRLTVRPDGMILVTGPTGSGKTTTLHSCLQAINPRERKIVTVEDPVEYQLPGINQVPVRPDFGMTFAAALRTILRQAPNIIMVGEIRDRETAEIAVHAALTGHLVFSTVHTGDAPGAVARLIDLEIQPFLVGAVLRGSLAQRLVRRICPECRRSHSLSTHERVALGLTVEQEAGATFARGEGCARCHGTGYFGRTGIFELFAPDEALRQQIHEGAGTVALRRMAVANGMRTLREDGMRKVRSGLTTVAEVVSITAGAIHQQ